MRSFSIFSLVIFLGCAVEDNTPTMLVNDPFDASKATLIKSGPMNGVGHSVSGSAAIYSSQGKKIVLLDPFFSQNGPDLRVYLSIDANASSYISMGKLKSTMGKQSYEVPGNPNVTDFNYILIWCEQFTVVFGRAALQ